MSHNTGDFVARAARERQKGTDVKGRSGGTIASLLAWWGWMPAVVGIVWGLVKLFGFGVANESWSLWFHNNIANGGVLLWVWLLIGAIGTMAIAGGFAVDSDGGGIDTAVTVTCLAGGLALLVFSIIGFAGSAWNVDKNLGRYYSTATTFYSPSLTNAPVSLHYLLKGAVHKAGSPCALTASSDVPTCIDKGTLGDAGFAPRASSAAGAIIAMQRSSGTAQNVNLLSDTLTYLNGNGKDGVWSAIRDGNGNIAPLEGVVEWSGNGQPSECFFHGSDSINKAINGARSNSLSNLLASRYPKLYWTESDVWGYCQGSHPVIVFPVNKQVRYLNRTLDAPGGVIIVKGSASGKPVLSYEPNASNLPGPVYATTIADQQMNASSWAVGRQLRTRTSFGYEPTNASAQQGNVQDYLLKSNADGHTYWVTPLTLRGSDSQLFVAYSMVRADEVHAGKLNPFSIYVLDQNDIRRVNVDSLEAAARDYVLQQDPGFLSSGGSLIEFTPTVGDIWRAFGEINGRVVYRLDISASNAVQPQLVSLENFSGSGSGQAPAAANASCGQPLTSLSQAQIVQCLKAFAGAVSSPAAKS